MTNKKKSSQTKKPILETLLPPLFSKRWLQVVVGLSILTLICIVSIFLKNLLSNLNQSQVETLLNQASLAVNNQQYSEALNLYLTALDYNPQRPEPYLNLAKIYRLKNQFDKAEEILLQGVSKLDNPKTIYFGLGETALEAQDYTNALKYLGQADDNLPTHLRTTEVYLLLGYPENAREEAEKALSMDQNNSEAYYSLAIIMADEDLDSAVSKAKLAVKYLDSKTDSLFANKVKRLHTNLIQAQDTQDSIYQLSYIGYALLTEKYPQLALKVLTSVTEEKPEYRDGQALSAAAYLNLKDYDKARTSLDKALSIDPNYAYLHYLAAQLEDRTNHPKAAQKHFKTLLALSPTDLNYYNDYLIFLKDQKDYQTLADTYQTILEIESLTDEKKQHYQTELAYLYLDHLGELQKGLSLAQNYPETEIQAWALYKNEQSKEALEIINTIIQQDTTAQLYYHQGYILKDLGRADEALQSFRRAVDLDTEGTISELLKDEL